MPHLNHRQILPKHRYIQTQISSYARGTQVLFHIQQVPISHFTELISILLEEIDLHCQTSNLNDLFIFEVCEKHLFGETFWEQYTSYYGYHRLSLHCDLIYRLSTKIIHLEPTTIWISGSDYTNLNLEIALVCNHRVLYQAENFKCRIVSSQYGIIPIGLSPKQLPIWLGYQRSLDAILTGRPITISHFSEKGFFSVGYSKRPNIQSIINSNIIQNQHTRTHLPIQKNVDSKSGDHQSSIFKYFKDLIHSKKDGHHKFGKLVLDLVESYTKNNLKDMWPKHLKAMTLLIGSPQINFSIYIAQVERHLKLPSISKHKELDIQPAMFYIKLLGMSFWTPHIAAYLLCKGFKVLFWDNHQSKIFAFFTQVEKLCLKFVNSNQLDKQFLRSLMSRIIIVEQDEPDLDSDLTIVLSSLNIQKNQLYTTKKNLLTSICGLNSKTDPFHCSTEITIHPIPSGLGGKILECMVPNLANQQEQITKEKKRAYFFERLDICIIWLDSLSRSLATDLLANTWNHILLLISRGKNPNEIARSLKEGGFGCCLISDLENTKYSELYRVLNYAEKAPFTKTTSLSAQCQHLRTKEPNSKQFISMLEQAKEQYLHNFQQMTNDILSKSFFHLSGEGRLPETHSEFEQIKWSIIRFAILSKISEKYQHSSQQIDFICVHLLGFPRHLGGPLYYCQSIGVDKIHQKLKELEKDFKEEFCLSGYNGKEQLKIILSQIPKRDQFVEDTTLEPASRWDGSEACVSPSKKWPNLENLKNQEPLSGQ